MAANSTTAKELLQAAHKAVVDAGIPEPLQEVAFTKAFDLLAGNKPATTPDGGGKVLDSGSVDNTFTGDERFAKIAQKTGADVNKLPYVYDIDDEGVSMLVKRSQLGNSDAAATRELALLVAAARQAGGFDTLTKIETIRERVEDMGVYDPKNFSTTVKGIPGVTIKGTGNTRELKVTQAAFEEAGKLLNRLTGGDS